MFFHVSPNTYVFGLFFSVTADAEADYYENDFRWRPLPPEAMLVITSRTKEASGSVRFVSVRRSAGSGSAGSVPFLVPASFGSKFSGGV